MGGIYVLKLLNLINVALLWFIEKKIDINIIIHLLLIICKRKYLFW